MKRILILTLLMAFTHHVFAGTGVKIKKIPAWTVEKDFNKKFSIKDGDVSQGYYDLLIDQQINIPAKQNYRHIIVKVLSDTGVQRISQIEIDVDPAYEKLALHRVRIIRGDKTLDRTNLKDLKVVRKEKGSDYYIYDGKFSAILNLKDVRVGDILDYSYSITGRNPVYKGNFFVRFYLGSYSRVDRMCVRVLSDNMDGLSIKHYNTPVRPKITETNNLHCLEWSVDNVKEVLFDDDVPSWYNPFPYVIISEFKDWRNLGRWALELFRIKKTSHPKLDAKINEIKKIAATDTEKVTRCLRFVQEEIRYLGFEGGIMGYKPHMPGEVFDRKYGDCKDQSLLLSYMLNKMDIPARPALVNTLYKQKIGTFLPTPSAFNHCIVQVRLVDEDFWYDPTRTSQRGDYKRMNVPRYKTALVLQEDIAGLTGIEYNPVNKVEVNEKIIMTSYEGPARLIVNTKFYGAEADNNRRYFKDTGMEVMKKNYANFYARDYDGIEILEDITYSDDEENNIFSTAEEYRIKNFAQNPDEDDANRFRIEVYPRLVESKLRIPETTIRTMPLDIGGPMEIYHTIELHTPEKWDVKKAESTISSKGLYFNGQVYSSDKTVFVVYTYKILKEYVDVDDAGEHIDNVEKVYKHLGYRWDFSRNDLPGGYRVNGFFIFIGIIAGIGAVLLMRKLFYYDPPPQIESPGGKKIGGWLIVVIIGLSMYLLSNFYSLLKVDFLDLSFWTKLTSKTSLYYSPWHAGLFLFEYIVNIMMTIYTIFIFMLFAKKRTSLPRLIIFFYLANIILVSIDNVGAWSLGLLDEPGQMTAVTSIFRTAVASAIWMLYFQNSDRVKDTFVIQLSDQSRINKMLDPKALNDITKLPKHDHQA